MHVRLCSRMKATCIGQGWTSPAVGLLSYDEGRFTFQELLIEVADVIQELFLSPLHSPVNHYIAIYAV